MTVCKLGKLFSKNLKKHRLERNLTQYDLGEKCGFGVGKIAGIRIGQYEKGTHSPTLHSLERMAKVLKVKAYELLE